jgi:hypothetical protein
MEFRTKIDFSTNRQVKQYPETSTYLSGATIFGVPFNSLVSGPDLTTSGITSSLSGITSSFSGNSGTTRYTWYNSSMNLGTNVLSAITPSNSGITQNTGIVFTSNTSTIIDNNTVFLTYSGVSFDTTPLTMISLGGGNYSGTVHTNILDVLSAGTLDFTGRTIWVDVSGITRTNDLIINKNPTVGYIWVCEDTEGKGSWAARGGVGSDYWSASTGTDGIVPVNSGSIASGTLSVAYGFGTVASNTYSHAEGQITVASGTCAHAEGFNTAAGGYTSHAENLGAFAHGDSSHAEGYYTIASGNTSHAEGLLSIAGGNGSHAENTLTKALGFSSHAQGYQTLASGFTSHAEGQNTIASGISAHAEGYYSIAGGISAHAEGTGTLAIADYSHAEGAGTIASGYYSHAEGDNSIASGDSSHAEGEGTIASGNTSHAEGCHSIAGGQYSHAKGYNTRAYGYCSYAEGGDTIASGYYTHAGGNNSVASGAASFIHSTNSSVTGNRSVVLGGQNITGATDDYVYVPSLNINTVGSGAFTNDIRIDGNGNLTTNTSDFRLKKNIKPITNALETIKGLNGVSYEWKDRLAGGSDIKLGFIAQDVEKVEPRLVFVNKNDGYLGIHSDNILPLLVEAIKEIVNNTLLNTNLVNLNAKDDVDAAKIGVPLYGLYRNENIIQIRLT